MVHYYELVIRGDERDLVAFLAGYAAAGGVSGAFCTGSEDGFHVKALRERIKHHGEVGHVICTAAQRGPIRAALERAAPRFAFEVKEERPIGRAHFGFTFETPSRQVADRIRAVLGGLPEGVGLADYVPEEVTDPRAKSAEVYSAAHDYVFRGSGTVQGDVRGVVVVRRALLALEFARCDEIDVDPAA